MSKIYYLMGKSSTGKDTIYKELRKRMPQLKNVTIYTTRPRREGEKEGEEYFFTDETELEKFKTEGRLIEERAYNTVYGIWHYFTADDGQFNFEQKNQDYLMIGTLESYEKLKTYFGNEKVVPLYIEVEDGERLTRALAREKTQKEPKYTEMCRRFLADSKDFSEENLAHAGITERYEKTDLEDILEKICKKILKKQSQL